jgi:hypothetical protein
VVERMVGEGGGDLRDLEDRRADALGHRYAAAIEIAASATRPPTEPDRGDAGTPRRAQLSSPFHALHSTDSS